MVNAQHTVYMTAPLYLLLCIMHTLQVEVLGPRSGLGGNFRVNLNHMQIVSVAGNVHIVPVVVI